jgi:hypothetical protein
LKLCCPQLVAPASATSLAPNLVSRGVLRAQRGLLLVRMAWVARPCYSSLSLRCGSPLSAPMAWVAHPCSHGAGIRSLFPSGPGPINLVHIAWVTHLGVHAMPSLFLCHESLRYPIILGIIRDYYSIGRRLTCFGPQLSFPVHCWVPSKLQVSSPACCLQLRLPAWLPSGVLAPSGL